MAYGALDKYLQVCAVITTVILFYFILGTYSHLRLGMAYDSDAKYNSEGYIEPIQVSTTELFCDNN